MLKPFALLAALALAAPALAQPAPDAGLLALRQMDQRVAGIAYRLARANLEICERRMPLSGMLVHSLDLFPIAAQPIAAATFGLAADPAVMVVVPDSAAAKAGLQPGDVLLSIAGRTFPPKAAGKNGNYARVREIEEHLLASMSAGLVPIDYARAGVRRTAMLEGEPGCVSRVQISVSPERNAKADGTYAQLTTGIINFARNDDELALVIAHEMAHNILGHRVRLKEQKVSRGLLKSIDGSAAKIRNTEVEADYLALYMLARAGYDLDAAPGFWQRYGPNSLLAIFSDGTHPGRSTRVAAAQTTIREIREKQQRGWPLTPSIWNPNH